MGLCQGAGETDGRRPASATFQLAWLARQLPCSTHQQTSDQQPQQLPARVRQHPACPRHPAAASRRGGAGLVPPALLTAAARALQVGAAVEARTRAGAGGQGRLQVPRAHRSRRHRGSTTIACAGEGARLSCLLSLHCQGSGLNRCGSGGPAGPTSRIQQYSTTVRGPPRCLGELAAGVGREGKAGSSPLRFQRRRVCAM
jgi:hypothetical protein